MSETMLVGISAGHGGPRPGAIGPSGLKEKDVTLAVAKKTSVYFAHNDASPVMARTADVALRTSSAYDDIVARTEMFNRAGTKFNLDIHCNAHNKIDINRLEAWVPEGSTQSRKLAELILEELARLTRWPNGGVKMGKKFTIFKCTAPTVLLEMGFITNTLAAHLLGQNEFQWVLAEGIMRGVCRAYGLPFRSYSSRDGTMATAGGKVAGGGGSGVENAGKATVKDNNVQPVKVVVTGKEVACGARLEDGRVVGQLAPVLKALGLSFEWGNGVLKIGEGK